MIAKRTQFIYTLRTKDDMGVFYVGCCDSRMCRVGIHRRGSRPVSVRIRELESQGREVMTVIEEAVEPSNNILRHWSFVERAYIEGYAKLIRNQLTNVANNPIKRKQKFVDMTS